MKRNTTTVLDTDHEGDLNATSAVADETVSSPSFYVGARSAMHG